MSLDLDLLLATPFHTTPFEGVVYQSHRPTTVQVTEDGLFLGSRFVPEQELLGCEFTKRFLIISFLEDEAVQSLVIKLKDDKLLDLQKQINLLRLRHYFSKLPNLQRLTTLVEQCPDCDLFFVSTKAECKYCPECDSIIRDGHSISHDSKLHFACTEDAYFSFVGTEHEKKVGFFKDKHCHGSQSFHTRVKNVTDHVKSHGIWLVFWGLIISLVTLFADSPLTLFALMILCFIHVTLIGYYFTGLLLSHSIRPLLFPPLWHKITRLIQTGKIEDAKKILQFHKLTDHPGFIYNFALAAFKSEQYELAWNYLNRALELCPNHPAFLALAAHYASKETVNAWQNQYKMMNQQNSLSA